MKSLVSLFSLLLLAAPTLSAAASAASNAGAMAQFRAKAMNLSPANPSDRKVTFTVNLQIKRVIPGAKAAVLCMLNSKSGGATPHGAIVEPQTPVAGADGNLSGSVNVVVSYPESALPSIGGWSCEAAAYTGPSSQATTWVGGAGVLQGVFQ